VPHLFLAWLIQSNYDAVQTNDSEDESVEPRADDDDTDEPATYWVGDAEAAESFDRVVLAISAHSLRIEDDSFELWKAFLLTPEKGLNVLNFSHLLLQPYPIILLPSQRVQRIVNELFFIYHIHIIWIFSLHILLVLPGPTCFSLSCATSGLSLLTSHQTIKSSILIIFVIIVTHCVAVTVVTSYERGIESQLPPAEESS
jgi:hypothetical protein